MCHEGAAEKRPNFFSAAACGAAVQFVFYVSPFFLPNENPNWLRTNVREKEGEQDEGAREMGES